VSIGELKDGKVVRVTDYWGSLSPDQSGAENSAIPKMSGLMPTN
jgi:hypothetical protein